MEESCGGPIDISVLESRPFSMYHKMAKMVPF